MAPAPDKLPSDRTRELPSEIAVRRLVEEARWSVTIYGHMRMCFRAAKINEDVHDSDNGGEDSWRHFGA